MTTLVLDFETSTQWDKDGRTDSTPYNSLNFLVSAGYCTVEAGVISPVDYLFFSHSGLSPSDQSDPVLLQRALDNCMLLVAHNAKFELNWLRGAGFTYDGPVWCTFIGEYVLARGRKDIELNLYDTSVRRGTTVKKSELVDEYFKKRIGFDKMPIELVREYGIADIQSCAEVYLQQVADYASDEHAILKPTLDLMNEFCVVLADMEWNGIAIDGVALDAVKQEYLKEQAALQANLEDIRYKVMGDLPVNLGSPEQLSMLIYSRRVLDKAAWAETFNLGKQANGKPLRRPRYSDTEFNGHVRRLTEKVRRAKAKQCPSCKGKGTLTKFTKSGALDKRTFICKDCDRTGIVYEPVGPYAGLRQSPRNVDDITSNGFATDKETLNFLAERVQHDKNAPLEAKAFLNSMVRLNAVDTYLSSFVGGIERNVRPDGLLHSNFNQCVTSTGRLSSSDP